MPTKKPKNILILLLTFALLASLQGQPIAADPGLSLSELQTQSTNGIKEAQNLLGLHYFTGNGVKENKLKAAELFTRAARQGSAPAQFNLAHMLHNGIGVQQNYTEACVWYKAAADQGHNGAQEAFDSLQQYISTEKLNEISRLSAQIPHNATAKSNKQSPDSDPNHTRMKNWLESIQPAAGR